MQFKAFASVAADTSYVEADLGYDPIPYSHHTVAVDTTATDTFEVLVLQNGSSTYRSIGQASKADGTAVAVGPEWGEVKGLRVEFTGGNVSAANVEIASFTLRSSRQE